MWSLLADWRFSAYYANDHDHQTELNLHGILFGCALAVLIALPEIKEKVRSLSNPYLVWAVCLGLCPILALKLKMFAMLPAVLPLVVLSTVLHPDHLLAKPLEWKAVAWIGRLSYSLYLWQGLFFVMAHSATRAPWTWFDRAPVNYIATFACAIFSFYVIETPLIRVGHRLGRRLSERGVARVPSGMGQAV